VETNAPLTVRTFYNLSPEEKGSMKGYAFMHYVKIFSGKQDKYARHANWRLWEKSVIDLRLRDKFTSWGRRNIVLRNGKKLNKAFKIFVILHKNTRYVMQALRDAKAVQLKKDWGEKPKTGFENRLNQWAELAAKKSGNPGIKRKLLDIIKDPE